MELQSTQLSPRDVIGFFEALFSDRKNQSRPWASLEVRGACRSALFGPLFRPYLGNGASQRVGGGLYGTVSTRPTRLRGSPAPGTPR